MSKHARDRRVRRTRGLLHAALGSLIHEKPYDGIVIKEILARANIGRSTFYTHYRDKDDLLDSGIRDLIAADLPISSPPGSGFRERVVACTLRLFEHIERHRANNPGSMDPRAQAVVHEHLRGELVRYIDTELERTRHEERVDVPTDLIAPFISSTFLVVMEWWLGSHPSLRGRDVNEHFAALVEPCFARRRARLSAD